MNFVNTLDEFTAVLRQHEIDSVQRFVCSYTPKSFIKEKIEVSIGQRLHWQDGIPYFHFGTRGYVCHQGKDRNARQKIKYAKRRMEKALMVNSFVKQYNRTKVTKKLGCPAVIRLTRAYRMSEYKIPFLTKKRKEKISSLIRQKLSAGEDLCGEEGYFFNLPSDEDHEHPPEESSIAIIEPVDDSVKYYVSSLVYEGKTDAVEVADLLENFVENEMNQFDRSRRRFFPDIKTIRRMISQAKRQCHEESLGKLDTFDIGELFFGSCSKGLMDDCLVHCDNEDDNDNMLQNLLNDCGIN